MQRCCNARSAHWTPAVKHDLDIFIYCSVFMCAKESHTSLTRLPLKLNFILVFVGTFKGKAKHSCEQKSYCLTYSTLDNGILYFYREAILM